MFIQADLKATDLNQEMTLQARFIFKGYAQKPRSPKNGAVRTVVQLYSLEGQMQAKC